MKLKLTLVIIGLSISIIGFAQNSSLQNKFDQVALIDSTPFKMVDTFFIKVRSDINWEIPIKYLQQNMPPSVAKGDILKIINTVKENKPIWGKYYGYEFISSKRINNTILATNYIVRFEYMPIKLTFIFYNPDNKWIVSKFTLDNELDQELVDILKYSLLETDLKK